MDFIETVYRYRFQGTTLEDRESILSSSDVGATFHYNFAGNYGDFHGGFYNGDNYNAPRPTTRRPSWSAARCGRCRCMRRCAGCA